MCVNNKCWTSESNQISKDLPAGKNIIDTRRWNTFNVEKSEQMGIRELMTFSIYLNPFSWILNHSWKSSLLKKYNDHWDVNWFWQISLQTRSCSFFWFRTKHIKVKQKRNFHLTTFLSSLSMLDGHVDGIIPELKLTKLCSLMLLVRFFRVLSASWVLTIVSRAFAYDEVIYFPQMSWAHNTVFLASSRVASSANEIWA